MIQEEKLEPIKNTIDDPRIRLLNRLYARKRKELKERERLKVIVTSLTKSELCASLAVVIIAFNFITNSTLFKPSGYLALILITIDVS